MDAEQADVENPVLYTAVARNREGVEGTSWTERGTRVRVSSPLSEGRAGTTDPEELLALAWATCLSASCRVVAPGREAAVRVEVSLRRAADGPGFEFLPRAYVSFAGMREDEAAALAAAAHERCPVSKLLSGRGAAEVVAEPYAPPASPSGEAPHPRRP